MKHAERKNRIEALARELAPILALPDVNRKEVKKAWYRKLYGFGLSATAVNSWYNAIEARALAIANEGRPLMGQLS